VKGYREIDEVLTAPPYIFLPSVDKCFLTKYMVEGVKYLRGSFARNIQEKRKKRGVCYFKNALIHSRELLGNVSICLADT